MLLTILAGARKLLVHKEGSSFISTILSFPPFFLEFLLILLLLLPEKRGDFVGYRETPWLTFFPLSAADQCLGYTDFHSSYHHWGFLFVLLSLYHNRPGTHPLEGSSSLTGIFHLGQRIACYLRSNISDV